MSVGEPPHRCGVGGIDHTDAMTESFVFPDIADAEAAVREEGGA